jgi:hypothetical protein
MESSRGRIIKSNKTSEENVLAYPHSSGVSKASAINVTSANASTAYSMGAIANSNLSSSVNPLTNLPYQALSMSVRDNNSSPTHNAQNLEPALSSSYDPSRWLKSNNQKSIINTVNAGFYSAPVQPYFNNPVDTYVEPIQRQINAISTEETMPLSANRAQAELVQYKQSNIINKHEDDLTAVNRLSKDNIIEKPNSLVADTPPYG